MTKLEKPFIIGNILVYDKVVKTVDRLLELEESKSSVCCYSGSPGSSTIVPASVVLNWPASYVIYKLRRNGLYETLNISRIEKIKPVKQNRKKKVKKPILLIPQYAESLAKDDYTDYFSFTIHTII